MEEHELAVFRNFTGKVDSMMTAHISISGLEPGNLPASLSPALVKGLLRDDMGFNGLIMTDDLDMGAILNHYGFEETMKRGVAAGNDLLMICHRIQLATQAKSALESLPAAEIEPALASVAKFKSRLVPPDPFSEAAFFRAGFGSLGPARFDPGRAAGGAAKLRRRQTLACRALLIPMRFRSLAKRKLCDAGFIEFAEAGGHHAVVLLLGGVRERQNEACSRPRSRAIPESFAACAAEK